jgi:hypothetical protein
VLLVCTVYSGLYSEIAVSRKPFGIGHMHIYTFLLRMTDTVTSQNTDLSSWDTPYNLDTEIVFHIRKATLLVELTVQRRMVA